MTCSTCGPSLPLIEEYVKKARLGTEVSSIAIVHEYLVEHAKYSLTLAALVKHIRECLGYSSRAR